MSPHDATLRRVVGRNLYLDLVARNDSDPSATAHLSRCARDNLETRIEPHLELSVPERLDDHSLRAEGVVASCHNGR